MHKWKKQLHTQSVKRLPLMLLSSQLCPLESQHNPLLVKKTPCDSITNPIKDLNLSAQYKTIGRTLSELEASYICAGVPWLPPTKKVLAIRDKSSPTTNNTPIKKPPLEEALRIGLVNVKTHVLESYYDDLESASDSQIDFKALSIEHYNLFEQFAFTLILNATAISASAIIGVAFIHNATVIASITISCGISATVLGLTLSLNPYRKASFATLISREILRRQGKGIGLPMTPITE